MAFTCYSNSLCITHSVDYVAIMPSILICILSYRYGNKKFLNETLKIRLLPCGGKSAILNKNSDKLFYVSKIANNKLLSQYM